MSFLCVLVLAFVLRVGASALALRVGTLVPSLHRPLRYMFILLPVGPNHFWADRYVGYLVRAFV